MEGICRQQLPTTAFVFSEVLLPDLLDLKFVTLLF